MTENEKLIDDGACASTVRVRPLCPLPEAGVSQEYVDHTLGFFSSELLKHVDKLTSRQQQCIALLFVDGYTEQEAADMLGITQSSVSLHKQAALKALRKAVPSDTLVGRHFGC